MKRNLALVFVIGAVSLSLAHGDAVDYMAAANSPAAQNYCPPGSKFCPAPGAENTVFLDTHFGMDAQTGQVVAYKGTVHPNDVVNPPMTGEAILYVAPPISVENRYVPYPGSPQTNMNASTSTFAQPLPGDPNASMSQLARPQSPTYYQQPVQTYQDFQSYQRPVEYRQPVQARPADADMRSEVANKQTDRSSREERITQGERVPWWKGGLWRNRGRDDDVDDDDDYIPPARSAGASSSRQSEDMWDDEEYTGYNPDGSFGRQGQAQNYSPAPDPYSAPVFADTNPYAQPVQSQYYDPYGSGPVTTNGPMYAGDAYTLPNSPPPTSPYQDGYAYPGTTYTTDGYSGYGQPSSPVYVDSPPIMTASAQPSGGAFLPPPPSSSPSRSGSSGSGSGGSMQFESAVQMVKDGRFSEAKNLLTAETRANPSNAAGWRWLGDCHYNLLELDAAITTYQRALDRDPNDYYALRGQGFSYLHRGHEYWRRMQEEVARGQREQAAATFAQAHENYKKSLELLGFCLRRAPNDGEAVYGEAMAAEGASRKLYSNAISYLKLGPENRERAELFAENCLTVINKGIERARERARSNPGESGPRALLGGLYLRKAILYNTLGKRDLAMVELKNSRDVQQSILDEIDKNNATAQKGVRECETYWEAWGGNRQG